MDNGREPGGSQRLDWATLAISGGLLSLFVIVALINIDFTAAAVAASFSFSANLFGAFWQVLVLATFLVAVALALSRYGRVRLGNRDEPEMSTFRWIAIVTCTLLAGGGVFFSASEPLSHFLTVPPTFSGIEADTRAAVAPALAQSYLHWGFLAFAIVGSLGAIVMSYGYYNRGWPLKPRTLLYPVFGERIMSGWAGTLVDAFSIIAVAAGTIGPIGFLGLQMSYALNQVLGIPDVYLTQLMILLGLVAIYTISAVTGISRGIQILSRFNVYLAGVMIAIILILGPGAFVINSFLTSMGVYVQNFFTLTLSRADTGWLNGWSVFFWGWFISYGPLMAIFVAVISRGRTIRQLVVAVSIIAPLVTNFWFTILGGSGLYYELQNDGSIAGPLSEAGQPAAFIAIIQQAPLAFFMVPAALVLVAVFLATTGDSMTYSMAATVSGSDEPVAAVRVFWGILMGAVAAVLIQIGEGGIGALQSFIVVAAVPVGFFLLPLVWEAPRVARRLAKEQGLLGQEPATVEEPSPAADRGVPAGQSVSAGSETE